MFPIHGQYSMMVNHGLMSQGEGIPEANVIIADNGTVVNIEKEKWWFDKVRAPSDYVFVDGLGIGDIGNVVLRDRQILAEDGMFVIVVLIHSKTGTVRGSPDIISRGFIYLKENKELLSQVRKRIKFIVEGKGAHQQPNLPFLKDQIRNQIGLFLFQKTERILPIRPCKEGQHPFVFWIAFGENFQRQNKCGGRCPCNLHILFRFKDSRAVCRDFSDDGCGDFFQSTAGRKGEDNDYWKY